MSVDRCRRSTVEEGRDHPFVQALLNEMHRRHEQLLETLEGVASGGDESQRYYVYTLGARAAELRRAIQLIEDAKGVEDGE